MLQRYLLISNYINKKFDPYAKFEDVMMTVILFFLCYQLIVLAKVMLVPKDKEL